MSQNCDKKSQGHVFKSLSKNQNTYSLLKLTKNDEEKLQILTVEKLDSVTVWHFCLKNDCNDE